jgi:hypothetical protein
VKGIVASLSTARERNLSAAVQHQTGAGRARNDLYKTDVDVGKGQEHV